MTIASELPEDWARETAASGPPSFDFGFDTEEFSDRILRLQFEDTDAGEPEGSGRQVYETRRSRRKLEGGRDDRESEGSTRSATTPGRDIKVNSLILAARSDFFRTMLLSGMREAGRDKPTIVLKIAKDGSRDWIVDSVCLVTKASDCAQDRQGRRGCNRDDAPLHVLRSTSAGTRPQQRRSPQATPHWRQDVAATWKGDEFLALSRATVAFLLHSELLEAPSEAEMFDGVLRWVSHMPGGTERKAHVMSDLSKHIRYRMIGGEKLRAMIGLDLMQLSKEIVMDAVWFRSMTDEEKARAAAESGGKAQFRERERVSSFHNFLEFPFLASQLRENTDVYSDVGLDVRGTFWQLRVQVMDPEGEDEKVGVFLNPTSTIHVDEPDWEREMRFDLGVKVWPSGWRVQVDPMHAQTFKEIDEGWGRGDAFDGLTVEELLKSKWVSREGIMTISTYFRPA
ncbi:hypothetical protein KFL_000110280 [Klebsormidium nitens]|uniref:BACK domain-containing protein n=1 Tax=Klebsormidium nitens TaxID=105231 RepID=A0A1Y1HMW0_KLENI|nr:hypothetical protein KFL_000110280 [Klebsormidium nitens]|eukprot:GAQ78331.1 hypothetical protein KFL_000110280 [Klebsormidium nitens]